jgi:hypothetical protein
MRDHFHADTDRDPPPPWYRADEEREEEERDDWPALAGWGWALAVTCAAILALILLRGLVRW